MKLGAYHCNIGTTHIGRLLVKFADVKDIVEETLNRTNMEKAQMYVGCDSTKRIPSEFNAVIGQ